MPLSAHAFQCIISREESHLLLEAFNSGEELENHEEDEDESSENDRVDITFNPDERCEIIGESWEEYDNSHATPDEEASTKLHEGLPSLLAEKTFESAIDHKDCNEEDDDLVELESIHKVCLLMMRWVNELIARAFARVS